MLRRDASDTRLRAGVEGLLTAVLAYVYTPDEEGDAAPADAMVQRVSTYVRRRNGRRVTVEEVAGFLGYSANHTSTKFRRRTGENLKRYLDLQCAEKAKSLLEYTSVSVTEIAQLLDFNDIFSFSRHFKRVTGRSPRAFRHIVLHGAARGSTMGVPPR